MSLSEEALALIAEANRRTDPAAVKAALQKIGRAGEPLAIIDIISHTLDSRGAVAAAAAEAVATLRRSVIARDLGIFERAFRHQSTWPYSATPWQKMTATDLPRITVLPGGAAVLQLAMCHPSGYVREEAVRRSATCSDGTEIAFLLFRANDWVKPVRELAQTALRARLTIDHVPDLVAAMPILDAMHRWGRLHGTIVDEIERLLRDPRAVPGLMVASKSPDRFVRRSAYRRLFEHAQRTSFGDGEASEGGPYRQAAHTPQAKLDLVAAAIGDLDPAIRTWAGRWLVEAPISVFASFVDELLRNRIASIRLGAANRLIADGSMVPWEKLLLDQSADVRALAQRVALEAGKDPDSEYRALVASTEGARRGAVLLGLSETGGPADALLVREHLRSGRPVVRRNALRALAKFEVEDITELALAALHDPSPSVSRTARDLLVARNAQLHGEDVWRRFAMAENVSSKRAALAVLANLGFWKRLPFLIRAFASSDATIRFKVSQYLARWLAREPQFFDRPSPALVEEIRALLRESRLPESVRIRLEAVLSAPFHG